MHLVRTRTWITRYTDIAYVLFGNIRNFVHHVAVSQFVDEQIKAIVVEANSQLVEDKPISDLELLGGFRKVFARNSEDSIEDEPPERFEAEADQENDVEELGDHEKHHPVPDDQEELLIEFLSQQMTAKGFIPLVGEDVHIFNLTVDKRGEGLGQRVGQVLSIPRNGEGKGHDAKVVELTQENGVQCPEDESINAQGKKVSLDVTGEDAVLTSNFRSEVFTDGLHHVIFCAAIVSYVVRHKVYQFSELIIPSNFGQLVGEDVGEGTQKDDPVKPAVVEQGDPAFPFIYEWVRKAQIHMVFPRRGFGVVVRHAENDVLSQPIIPDHSEGGHE